MALTSDMNKTPVDVLLLTHSGDFYTIDLVERELADKGISALRINTDQFPTRIGLSANYNSTGTCYSLDSADGSIDLNQVKAVWARKLWPGSVHDEKLEPNVAATCTHQSHLAFMSIMPLLQEAYWMNDVGASFAAESKPLQLKVALDVGFEIPETIISNHPEQVGEFCQKHHQTTGVITKRLGTTTQSMENGSDAYFTTLLSEQDFKHLPEVRLIPQIFQPLVPKQREVRAIVVEDDILAGAIDTRESKTGQIDWRIAEEDIPWQHESLPKSLETKIQSFMKRLGLAYGAIDFIVTPDDRYIFLEVNPAGEWGWLQRDLDLPIASAIATNLIKRGNM